MQCISYPLHVHRIPSTLDADASEANHADVETQHVSPTTPRAGRQPVWQHEQQKVDVTAEVQNTEQDTTSDSLTTAGQYRALSIKTAANPLPTLETLSSQVEQLRKLVLVLMLVSGVTMLLVIRAALSPSSTRKRKS